MGFKGFSNEGITFLKNLSANNNKEWFESNRPVYEKYILVPMKELATELGPLIKSIDAGIETTPAVNKTISKIYRDIRFSNDKSPFRTGLWISFRRPDKIWGNAPEFYFYFTPSEYQYGMGFYSATPANMAKFRAFINNNPERFSKITSLYLNKDNLLIGGEDYKKKVPNDHPEVFQRWYQKRNLFISTVRKIDSRFYLAGLKQEIEDSFKLHSALYLFLIECIFAD